MDTPIDTIQKLFEGWHHSKWGFVIYRCTYASDDDFKAFILRLKTYATDSIEFHGADSRPIVQHLTWTVVEDREELDGASTADVRRRFDDWCRSDEAAAEQPDSAHPVSESPNARYRFAVQIDQASLESFKIERRPFVNLVLRKWPFGLQGDDEDDDDDDVEEGKEGDEAEGSTEEDVGWCKVRVSSLLPSRFWEFFGSKANPCPLILVSRDTDNYHESSPVNFDDFIDDVRTAIRTGTADDAEVFLTSLRDVGAAFQYLQCTTTRERFLTVRETIRGQSQSIHKDVAATMPCGPEPVGMSLVGEIFVGRKLPQGVIASSNGLSPFDVRRSWDWSPSGFATSKNEPR